MCGVKETQCTTCAHREVCALKGELLSAQKAIDNLEVSLGDRTVSLLANMTFIIPVNVRCRHYLKKEPTVR